jgi:hypothetical protein
MSQFGSNLVHYKNKGFKYINNLWKSSQYTEHDLNI